MGASADSKKDGIPGLTCLAPSVYIRARGAPGPKSSCPPSRGRSTRSNVSAAPSYFSYDTSVTTVVGRSQSPEIILLTSWTGAAGKHIAKYTQGYSELYPDTPIIVVRTAIEDLVLRSTAQKISQLSPAIAYINGVISSSQYSHDADGGPSPGAGVLLHAFSEGGSNKAVCIANAYLAAMGSRLPITACILDSTPGLPRFSNNLAAFRRSLPRNPVMNALGLLIGTVVLSITWTLFKIFIGRDNNVITKTRKALNDDALWPVAGVPRTYIFSESDDLVNWRDVEHHADETANVKGVTSLVVRYKDTAHCNHLRADEPYYWAAVRKTWDSRRQDDGYGMCKTGIMVEEFPCPPPSGWV